MSKRVLVRYVLEAIVCIAAILMLLMLSGCNPAASGYDAIRLAESLPDAARLPKDVLRSPFGLAFTGGRRAGGEIKSFGLWALTDKEGRVLCKTYSFHEGHLWGFLITDDRRLIVEIQIPERWFRPAPESWTGKEAASRLKSSWPKVEKRIRWSSGTAGEDTPAAPQKKIPDDSIGSTNELIQAIGRIVLPRYVASRKRSVRHAGLYIMLIHKAMADLPCSSDRESTKHILYDQFALLLNTPGAFSRMNRAGASWRQRTPDGYAYRVRNIGQRRIRIEITHGEIQSPFGKSYR
jgi:hypothetical protein